MTKVIGTLIGLVVGLIAGAVLFDTGARPAGPTGCAC